MLVPKSGLCCCTLDSLKSIPIIAGRSRGPGNGMQKSLCYCVVVEFTLVIKWLPSQVIAFSLRPGKSSQLKPADECRSAHSCQKFLLLLCIFPPLSK